MPDSSESSYTAGKMRKKNRLGAKGWWRRSLRKRHKQRGGEHTLLGAKGYALGYLNMPKAACTTIKNILFFLHNGHWYADPLHIHKAIKHDSAVLCGESYVRQREEALASGQRWLNFTFVRDPGKRVYSAFVEKIWATGPYAFPRIRQHLVDQGGLTLAPLGSPSQAPGKDEVAASFRAFLEFVPLNLAHKTPFPANPHWCVQSRRIKHAGVSGAVDFIGRVERFGEDMATLLSEVGHRGIDLASHRFNEGPRPPHSLADIMDSDMAEQLWSVYASDYEKFGYRDPRELVDSGQTSSSIED